MSTNTTYSGAMKAITISREYGSGGGEIAHRLAERLGWKLLDHEIVTQVAQRIGLSENEADDLDERGEGFWGRLLARMEYATPIADSTLPLINPDNSELNYQGAVRQLLLKSAEAGQVVIVGRGGSFALADRRDVLRVKIIAPRAARISYVMSRENLSPQQAQQRINDKEQQRKRALQEAYGQTSGDEHIYDLIINTGVLALDSAINLIVVSLHDKEQQLGKGEEALGPGAGLDPYPAPTMIVAQ